MKNKNFTFRLMAVAFFTAAFSLSSYSAAKVQVIHNCAAPGADTVDIWLKGFKVIDNLVFRKATGFINAPANEAIVFGIAPKNSTSQADTIVSFAFPPLTDNQNYIIMASGVIGTGFASNPNGRNINFDLKVIAPAQTVATNSAKVDFAIFHGATDAPGVDVKVSGGGPTLAADAKYGDATAYLSVDPTWYPIDILPAGGSTPVASYVADLSTLTGGAAVVFASGFLTPASNNNGAAFGLFAALASGTVIELPLQQNASVQVIHNCAAPGADSVDVYVDGAKAIPNFKFRTATPFIPLLAGVNHTIVVASPNSSSVAQALATFPGINLAANGKYVVIASGVVGTGFAANPDGRNTAFDLKIIANAQTAATNSAKVDFAIFHGATDAPGVDVKVAGGGPTLAADAKYGDATPYLSVDPLSYIVDVLPAGGTTPVATYVADLSGLTGGAAVVFASGFLAPASNNNGAAFGLFAALANGDVAALPLYTSVGELAAEIGWTMFPNPNQGNAFINFELKKDETVSVEILDLNGRVVKQLINTKLAAGRQNLSADLGELANGMYVARISTTDKSAFSKFTLSR